MMQLQRNLPYKRKQKVKSHVILSVLRKKLKCTLFFPIFYFVCFYVLRAAFYICSHSVKGELGKNPLIFTYLFCRQGRKRNINQNFQNSLEMTHNHIRNIFFLYFALTFLNERRQESVLINSGDLFYFLFKMPIIYSFSLFPLNNSYCSHIYTHEDAFCQK